MSQTLAPATGLPSSGPGIMSAMAVQSRWTDDHALYRWHHRPRLLPRANWSCGRTLRTCPQARLLTATCMLLPLRVQCLPCVPLLKVNFCALRSAVASARRVTTDEYFRHARSIARVVQHRAAFGETQVLAILPRLAATTHSRTSGLASSGVVRLVRVRTMWHSSPRICRHANMQNPRTGFDSVDQVVHLWIKESQYAHEHLPWSLHPSRLTSLSLSRSLDWN